MLIPRKHVGLEQKGYHHHLIEMKHALTMIWLKNWPSLTHIRITIYLVNMIRPFVCSFLIIIFIPPSFSSGLGGGVDFFYILVTIR
jgi:hypothetical protein